MLRKILFLVLLMLFCYQSTPVVLAESGGGRYQNLEKIPTPSGSGTTSSFTEYLKMLYEFGIAIVAILAVVMIAVGGFSYIVTSAGNASKVMDAKGMITSAVLGLLMALLAWLILYTINPDLISGTLTGTSGGVDNGSGGGGGGGSGSNYPPGNGNGKCEPVTAGICSVDSLSQNSCWKNSGADLSKMSALCNRESGGRDGIPSKTDKCTDGTPFSYGAMQVNLTCLCKGQGAFSGPEPGAGKGCANFRCTGKGSTYNSCVSKYASGQGHLDAACGLYKAQGYRAWSTSKGCGY